MGGAAPRAAARAWRAPDLRRCEHRGRLTASRVLCLALALFALFKPIAVVRRIGQAIAQRQHRPGDAALDGERAPVITELSQQPSGGETKSSNVCPSAS